MSNIKFFKEVNLPLEMHKVRIVQKLHLLPIDERLKAIKEAGNNTFLLKNQKGSVPSFYARFRTPCIRINIVIMPLFQAFLMFPNQFQQLSN